MSDADQIDVAKNLTCASLSNERPMRLGYVIFPVAELDEKFSPQHSPGGTCLCYANQHYEIDLSGDSITEDNSEQINEFFAQVDKIIRAQGDRIKFKDPQLWNDPCQKIEEVIESANRARASDLATN